MLEFLLGPVPVAVSPVSQGTIDLSQLDTIAGAIGGAIVVLLVMLVIGFFLIKFKIVNFAGKDQTDLAQTIVDRLEETIGELKQEIRKYSEEHRLCQNSLPERFMLRHDIERILDEVKDRQLRLREEILPRDYVRKEEMQLLVKRIDSIDDKLDTLLSRTKN